MRGTMKAGTWGGRKYRAQIKSREAEEKEREKYIQKGLRELGIGESRKLKITPAGEGRMPARHLAEYHTPATAFDMGEMQEALMSEYDPPKMSISYRDLGSNLLTEEQISRRRQIQTAVGSVPAFPDPSKMEEARERLGREFDVALEEHRQSEVGRTRFDGVIVPPQTDDEAFDTEALKEQAQGVAPAQMIEDDEGNIIGEEYGTEAITIGQGALAVQQEGMDVVETYEPETKPDVYERWKAQEEAKRQMEVEAKPSKKSGDELSDLMGGMVVQSKLEKEVERRGLLPEAVKLRPQSKDIDDDFSRSMVIMSQMGARHRMEAIGGRAEDLAKELEGMEIDISKPAGERDSPALVGLIPKVLGQSTLDMQYNPMESREDRRKRLAQAGKLSIVQIEDSARQVDDPTRPPLAGEGDAPSKLYVRAGKGEGTQSLIYGREQYGAEGRTRPLGLHDQGLIDAQKAKVKTKKYKKYVDKDGKPVSQAVLDSIKPTGKTHPLGKMTKKQHTEHLFGQKQEVVMEVAGGNVNIDPYFGGARSIHQEEKKKATKRREARTKHQLYLKRLQEEDPQKFYDERVKFNYGAHEGREDLLVSGLTEEARARPQSTATSHQPALSYGATEWHPPLNEGEAPQAQLEQIAPIGYVPLSYAGGDLPTGEALDREFFKDEATRTKIEDEIRGVKSVSWMPEGEFKKQAIAKKLNRKPTEKWGKKNIPEGSTKETRAGFQYTSSPRSPIVKAKKKKKKKLPAGLAKLAKGL